MLFDYVMARSWNIIISNKFESESGSSVGHRKAIGNGSRKRQVENVRQFPASTIKTLHHQGILAPNREHNEKNTISKLVTGASFFEAFEALFIDIRRHPHSVDSMKALKRFPYHTSVCLYDMYQTQINTDFAVSHREHRNRLLLARSLCTHLHA